MRSITRVKITMGLTMAEIIILVLVMFVLLLSIILSILFYLYPTYFVPTEPDMRVVDKSQVISAILTFGGLIGAAFIPIWQFAVVGRVSRLERTRSFWEGHRDNDTFRAKRVAVRKEFGGKNNIVDIRKQLQDEESHHNIQDVCNFYERLASGIKKGYYDEEEAKEYFRNRLIDDYNNAKHFIDYKINKRRKENRPIPYEDFRWLQKSWSTPEDKFQPDTSPKEAGKATTNIETS
jgi:hypothetical protein